MLALNRVPFAAVWVCLVAASAAVAEDGVPQGYVTALYDDVEVKVREGVIDTLSEGQSLMYDKIQERWYRVRIQDSSSGEFKKGWIHVSLINVVPFADSGRRRPDSPRPLELTIPKRNSLLAEKTAQWKKATQLDGQGKLAEAVAVGHEVLAIDRLLYNDVHSEVAFDLEWLAERYEPREFYEGAQGLRGEALETRRKLLGEGHWRVIDARTAVDRVERLISFDSKQRKQIRDARQLDQQAIAEMRAGKYQAARRAAGQALKIRQSLLGDRHRETGDSLKTMALLHQATGDYSRAESLLQQSLAIASRVLGDRHPDTATALYDLASLYKAMTEYDKAVPLHKRALEIRTAVFGPKHQATATSLNALGALYSSMGEYTQAEPLLRKTLEVRRAVLGEKHPNTATSLNNLGMMYLAMREFDQAERLLKQCLQLSEEVTGAEHPDYALGLNNLAGLYRAKQDFPRAEQLYRQALAIYRKVLGDEHQQTANSLNNLGSLYTSLGEFDKAEPFYRESLEIARKVLGHTHPQTASSLKNLFALYVWTDQYDQADLLIKEDRRMKREEAGIDDSSTAVFVAKLADLYQQKKDYRAAERLLRQAFDVIQSDLDRIAVARPTTNQLSLASDARRRLENYVAMAIEAGRFPLQAYEQVLRWKGTTLASRAASILDKRHQLQPLHEELESLTRRFAALTSSAPDPQQHLQWQSQLAEVSQQIQTVAARVASRSQEAAILAKQLSVAEIQAALPEDAALVDLLVYDVPTAGQSPGVPAASRRRLAAFVVRRDRPVRLIGIADFDGVERAMRTWRDDYGDSPQARLSGWWLRERLWAPIESALTTSSSDAAPRLILLSPDGMLGGFPFAALPGRRPDSYLLEDYALAVVAAPQVLPGIGGMPDSATRDADRVEPFGKLLMFGGVDYDSHEVALSESSGGATSPSESESSGRSRRNFSALDGTYDELDAVMEAHRVSSRGESVQMVRGASATEESFRQLAPHYAYLHVATHAYFPREPGDARLMSGVALAGANRPDPQFGDGLMTAAELASLDLWDVQLTVLSTCETSGQRATEGDGVLGLQRAFQAAGARATVTSLWKIDQPVRQLLLGRFYRNLWGKKMSRLDALREAQLWMLRDFSRQAPDEGWPGFDAAQLASEDGRLPPYYWAPLVLSGDWR